MPDYTNSNNFLPGHYNSGQRLILNTITVTEEYDVKETDFTVRADTDEAGTSIDLNLPTDIPTGQCFNIIAVGSRDVTLNWNAEALILSGEKTWMQWNGTTYDRV